MPGQRIYALPGPIDLAEDFVGPKFDAAPGATRKHYPHRLNETCSLKDHVIPEVAHITIRTAAEEAELKSSQHLVHKYRKMIREHIERRVAIFFQQLVVCYQTQLHFESSGSARHQAESAKPLKIKRGRTVTKITPRNAAHSSTHPCLIAYDRTAWQRHQTEGGEAPQGFIYVEGSDTYRISNATLSMVKIINEADTAIDGKRKDIALRTRSLAIINRASTGEITPNEGLEEFLELITTITEEKKGATTRVGIRSCLTLYEKYLGKTTDALDTNPALYDQFLNVRVSEDEEAEQMRRIVHQIRYQAIRQHQYAQAKMAKKIDKVRKKVLENLGQARTPNYFDDAFRATLIEEIRTDHNKKRIQKFLAFPYHDYHLRQTQSRTSSLSRTKELVAGQRLVINRLARSLARALRSLDTDVVERRASITCVLRKEKGWSQRDLSREIAVKFPLIPNSQSTVCRCETGKRVIDRTYATHLSAVFRVDPGCFMPSYFNPT